MPCTDGSLPLLLLGITSERRKPFWRDDASPGWKMESSCKLRDHGLLECSLSNWSPTKQSACHSASRPTSQPAKRLGQWVANTMEGGTSGKQMISDHNWSMRWGIFS